MCHRSMVRPEEQAQAQTLAFPPAKAELACFCHAAYSRLTRQLPGKSPGQLVTRAGEMDQERKALVIKPDNFGAHRREGEK